MEVLTTSLEDTSTLAAGAPRRFFATGKRIPINVKRHCGICRQHGIMVETRGHNCPRKTCDCRNCNLVRERRSIMSTQIRLRREQDKHFQRTNDASQADVVLTDVASCYFCQKCKNHGVLALKKQHKRNCRFADCHCTQCELIDTRRAIDQDIKINRKRSAGSGHDSSSSSSSPEKDEIATPPPPKKQTPKAATAIVPVAQLPFSIASLTASSESPLNDDDDDNADLGSVEEKPSFSFSAIAPQQPPLSLPIASTFVDLCRLFPPPQPASLFAGNINSVDLLLRLLVSSSMGYNSI